MAIPKSTFDRLGLIEQLRQKQVNAARVKPERVEEVRPEVGAARPEKIRGVAPEKPLKSPLPLRQRMRQRGTSVPNELRSQNAIEPTPAEAERAELRQRL